MVPCYNMLTESASASRDEPHIVSRDQVRPVWYHVILCGPNQVQAHVMTMLLC